jgi:hypothetical protein
MGFIGTKNFMAPLSNKVHLAAILFIACLFAAFRLSGGGARVVPRGEIVRDSQAVQSQIEFERQRIREEMESGRRITRDAQVEEALIGGNRRGSAEKASEREANALDDIERQLGLR